MTSGATKNFALKKVTSKIVVKKAPAKLTPTKLTAKKGVKKYFKVTVKNTKTKKSYMIKRSQQWICIQDLK